jgi:hypothetical protein
MSWFVPLGEIFYNTDTSVSYAWGLLKPTFFVSLLTALSCVRIHSDKYKYWEHYYFVKNKFST